MPIERCAEIHRNTRAGSVWTGSPPSLVKRIAVCISGEFRHVHHRTPEQQVRQLLAFLTGVDCDVFVHGWHNSSEALILNDLAPRAYKFEQRPSLGDLAKRIRFVEPNIKPGRDEGSLAMFTSLERCFKLVEPFADDYSHVLRIRPDLVVDYSFLEILGQIDAAGIVPGGIYVPHMFHSKGINDQIAFGPIDRMRSYFNTLTHVTERLDREFFNPETALLRNLIAHDVPIVFATIPFALMREQLIRINTAHERFHAQFGIWWSRTEWLPLHRDLSGYFRQKLRAVDDLMKGAVPASLRYRVPLAGDGSRHTVVHLHAIDADPVRSRATSRDETPEPRRQTFVFKESNEFVISEWRMVDGALRNDMLTVPAHDVIVVPLPTRFVDTLKMWRKIARRLWRAR